jgi:hypothetical protein
VPMCCRFAAYLLPIVQRGAHVLQICSTFASDRASWCPCAADLQHIRFDRTARRPCAADLQHICCRSCSVVPMCCRFAAYLPSTVRRGAHVLQICSIFTADRAAWCPCAADLQYICLRPCVVVPMCCRFAAHSLRSYGAAAMCCRFEVHLPPTARSGGHVLQICSIFAFDRASWCPCAADLQHIRFDRTARRPCAADLQYICLRPCVAMIM